MNEIKILKSLKRDDLQTLGKRWRKKLSCLQLHCKTPLLFVS